MHIIPDRTDSASSSNEKEGMGEDDAVSMTFVALQKHLLQGKARAEEEVQQDREDSNDPTHPGDEGDNNRDEDIEEYMYSYGD